MCRYLGHILNSIRTATFTVVECPAGADIKHFSMTRQEQVLQVVKDFTLAEGKPPTLQQVADVLGITRERVRQLAVKLRADGLLEPTSRSLALPGGTERAELNKEATDSQLLEAISDWDQAIPPTRPDLLGVVPGIDSSIDRLKQAGKIYRSQWLVPTTRPEFTEEDLFWLKVKHGSADDCWIWEGSINRSLGYGLHSRYYFGENHRFVHQIAYMIANGLDSIKPKHYIFHKCGVKLCCNPKHLVQTNNSDWYKIIAPEDKWVISKPKLCLDDAIDIRDRVQSGEPISKVYADYEHDICYGTALNIARGKTYTRDHAGNKV
jgi:hypothetical protein